MPDDAWLPFSLGQISSLVREKIYESQSTSNSPMAFVSRLTRHSPFIEMASEPSSSPSTLGHEQEDASTPTWSENACRRYQNYGSHTPPSPALSKENDSLKSDEQEHGITKVRRKIAENCKHLINDGQKHRAERKRLYGLYRKWGKCIFDEAWAGILYPETKNPSAQGSEAPGDEASCEMTLNPRDLRWSPSPSPPCLQCALEARRCSLELPWGRHSGVQCQRCERHGEKSCIRQLPWEGKEDEEEHSAAQCQQCERHGEAVCLRQRRQRRVEAAADDAIRASGRETHAGVWSGPRGALYGCRDEALVRDGEGLVGTVKGLVLRCRRGHRNVCGVMVDAADERSFALPRWCADREDEGGKEDKKGEEEKLGNRSAESSDAQSREGGSHAVYFEEVARRRRRKQLEAILKGAKEKAKEKTKEIADEDAERRPGWRCVSDEQSEATGSGYAGDAVGE